MQDTQNPPRITVDNNAYRLLERLRDGQRFRVNGRLTLLIDHATVSEGVRKELREFRSAGTYDFAVREGQLEVSANGFVIKANLPAQITADGVKLPTSYDGQKVDLFVGRNVSVVSGGSWYLSPGTVYRPTPSSGKVVSN